MSDRQPAEVFPLCDFLSEELACRQWTAADLVATTWMGVTRAEEILAGGKINMKEAELLSSRLGVSPGCLLTLQMQWLKRPGQGEGSSPLSS